MDQLKAVLETKQILADRQKAFTELKDLYNDYFAKQIVTVKLTKDQVRKLLKKKEITIAQFKFIIDD